MVYVETKHSNQFIKRTALLAYEIDNSLPVLYLPDNQQALKVGGETKIEGTVFLSERGVERAYIAGKNYLLDQLVYGKIEKSERILPALRKEVQNLSLETFIKDCNKVEYLSKDSIYDFAQKTTLFSEMNPLTIQSKISGNVIIHSFDSIYVTSEAKLKNVILIAPKIRFQEGFKGSVQAIAHQTIVCEKNVNLTYPSTLVLNELENSALGMQASIFLHENAKVLGGILIQTQNFNFRNVPHLEVSKNSLVAGLVYNVGETELKGKLIGYLYTQKFILNAGGGVYMNHLLDATLSSKLLPENFLIPLWLEQMKSNKAKIISCF